MNATQIGAFYIVGHFIFIYSYNIFPCIILLYYIPGSYIISGFMGYCGIYLAIYGLV